MKPHAHCHFCGAKHESEKWPRVCGACHGTTWRNPIPIVVVLVPVGDGLLVGKRGIHPGFGQFAHTAGYMELGESWQQAASRELLEETGVNVPADLIQLHGLRMASSTGNLLVFCKTPPLVASAFDIFKPNHEVTELMVITEPTELAFPTHTEMADRYFEARDNRNPNLKWA